MSSIEDLITNYQPTESTIELVKSTKIALLAGISGAGKDTIKKQLLKSSEFRDIVSHTTRAPRANNGCAEQDGIDYHFIDSQTAENMLQNNEFIEAKFVHGTVYGTSVAELRLAHDQNRVAITDIDVQGVEEYERLAPDSIAIFIVPPNSQTWIERLKKAYALEVPYYHVIINDDLERAIRVTEEIILRGDVFKRQDDEARLVARNLLNDIINL